MKCAGGELVVVEAGEALFMPCWDEAPDEVVLTELIDSRAIERSAAVVW